MNCPVCGSLRKPEYKKCPTCGVDFANWLETFIKKLNKRTDIAVNQAKQRKNKSSNLSSNSNSNLKTEQATRYKEVVKQTPKKKFNKV